MSNPRESVIVEFSSYPAQYVGLYNELVNRHDHLKWAIHVRSLARKELQAKCDRQRQMMLSVVSESIIWFFAIEYYSRFLSDPAKPNNSKRCLLTLIRSFDKASCEELETLYAKFVQDNKEVISYLKTQRDKYFAHADEVSWDEFPNLINDEDSNLLNGVAQILTKIASVMNLRTIPSQVARGGRLFF